MRVSSTIALAKEASRTESFVSQIWRPPWRHQTLIMSLCQRRAGSILSPPAYPHVERVSATAAAAAISGQRHPSSRLSSSIQCPIWFSSRHCIVFTKFQKTSESL
jgi:hypothetical protein